MRTMDTTEETPLNFSEWTTTTSDGIGNVSSYEQLEEFTPTVQINGLRGISVPFVVQFLVGVSILVANLLILLVLHRCRVVTCTVNRLLQSLAVADLGMAVASIYRAVLMARYGNDVEERPLRCGPAVVLFVLSSGGSVSSLLLIAIDQWRTARQSAMVEERQRWRRQSRWGIGVSWVLWVVLSLLGVAAIKPAGQFEMAANPCLVTGKYAYNMYWQLVGNLLLVMCILTVVFQILSLRAVRANILNLMEAVEQRHQGFMINPSCASSSLPASIHPGAGIFELRPPKKKYQVQWSRKVTVGVMGSTKSPATTMKTSTSSVSNIHTIITQGDCFEMNLAKTRLRLTKTITYVTLIFAICWFGYLPSALILSACGESCAKVHSQLGYLGTLVIANSLMNAFIYAFRIKQFRKALREVCSKKGSGASVQPVTTRATIGELGLPPIAFT